MERKRLEIDKRRFELEERRYYLEEERGKWGYIICDVNRVLKYYVLLVEFFNF